jgi:bifunctional enzyme CysN/CysC
VPEGPTGRNRGDPVPSEISANVVWHPGSVAREDRLSIGVTVWLTGLSGSGKSTIAAACEQLLIQRSRPAYLLDGDNLRFGLNGALGFSPADRRENVRRVGEVALLMSDAGLTTLVPVISPYAAGRAQVEERHRAARVGFIEVHVATSLDVCEGRDPKGLYAKARAGLLPGFTGIDDPYEAPSHPDLTLTPAEGSALEQARLIIGRLPG